MDACARNWLGYTMIMCIIQSSGARWKHRTSIKDNDDIRMTSHTRSGTQWTEDIIVTVWDEWYKVWTMRNSIIHGHDQKSRAKHQRDVDTRRLQSIYQSWHLMEPSVQEILFPTIEEHQQLLRGVGRRFIIGSLFHETTFIQSAKNVSKRAIQGVRSIKTYFAARLPSETPAPASHYETADTDHLPSRVKRPQTIMSYFVTGRRPPETYDSEPTTTVTP
jgi:hypothetical protein